MPLGIKHVLVTGSSGMIGTRLCEALIKRGYKVTGIDKNRNVWNKAVDFLTIKFDLLRGHFPHTVPKVDCIIHLAANARVYNLVKDPILARDNFEMTFNTLEFARKNSIKNFIFASSREVYGNSKKAYHNETDAMIDRCESPYTASKIASEALLQSYHQCYGIDFLIFRFSNVYGMYDQSDRVIPLFIESCLKRKDLKIYGKEKTLDFTYIDDTVSGILLGLKNFFSAKNEVYNLASGCGDSIIHVARLIRKFTKSSNKFFILNNRSGEIIKYIANIQKARKNIGFKPVFSIEDGLSLAVEWYKNFYSSKYKISFLHKLRDNLCKFVIK